MNEAKIRLSAKEMELATNADWILTKNEILKKAKHVLEAVMEEQLKIIPFFKNLPAEIVNSSPKISRGENYKGLPYLVLDHPRYFANENVFAIRTIFWWGNFFSTTLHLSGQYKKRYELALSSSWSSLKENFYCCINDDPWEHHFEKDNYVAVSELNEMAFKKIIDERSFIKFARKHSLREWDNAVKNLTADFKLLLKIMEIHSPFTIAD